jgi:phosphoglucosamine mutase
VSRKYFGTDGVRGRVGEEPITPEFAMRLGYAAGKVLAATEQAAMHGERSAVLIGKDTRISGYMLESVLQAGLTAAGSTSASPGRCPPRHRLPDPRPAPAGRRGHLRVPQPVRGQRHQILLCARGTKLPDDVELAIEAALDEPMRTAPSKQLGRVKRVDDAAARYIEFCKSTFPTDMDLRGMRIVVDCANGAGYHIAPHVFHELGADVIAIGNEPNGMNINKECGATHTDALSRAVRKHRADVGIALDGDGDRLMMADASGQVMDGDKLIYAIARYRNENGQALGGVVGTLMTNLGTELALKALGCEFRRAKVGDRYVLELLQQNGWQLGGESSGHILCLDKHSTGDGIVSALQVLAALRGSGRSLADYTRDCPSYPQILLNVRVAKGFKTDGHAGVAQAVAEVEAELGETGRVVLRPSGTEPLIRVMVEGRDEAQVRRTAEHIAGAVRTAAGM